MEIITMTCAQNTKVIINLTELRSSERLNGACVFNRLFNIDNKGFQEEKVNKELFKIYDVCRRDWYVFLNFIRNGRIKFDLASQFIQNDHDRKSYQKLFIQELDCQSNSGIFLKFGPFPIFDEYLETSVQRNICDMVNEKNNRASHPMTPEQDINNLYDWTASHIRLDETWSVTVPVKETPHTKYWRRLRQR
tara:strand:- start:720 stop:1295 length:576 start_codon:yes stop_codon:yes gene_type:complete